MLKQSNPFSNGIAEAHYPSSDLLEQTRQLFHHQGSDAELVEVIHQAINAIQELCQQPIR